MYRMPNDLLRKLGASLPWRSGAEFSQISKLFLINPYRSALFFRLS